MKEDRLARVAPFDINKACGNESMRLARNRDDALRFRDPRRPDATAFQVMMIACESRVWSTGEAARHPADPRVTSVNVFVGRVEFALAVQTATVDMLTRDRLRVGDVHDYCRPCLSA